MHYRIWSSLPLDCLREELCREKIAAETYTLSDSRSEIEKADIVFGSLPEDASLSASARWFQLDSSDTRGLNTHKNDTQVTNLSGLFSDAVAESILGAILGAERGLFLCADHHLKRKADRWGIRKTLRSLVGENVYILGGGAVAKSLVRFLRPFECRITVFRRKAETKGFEACRLVTKESELDQDLAAAHVLVNMLPSSEATLNFLNKVRLHKLPKDAVIVSAGRGSTVDEEALLAELQKGRFSAVVLDVTKTEPLATDHPFWTQDRVLLTQHTFGGHQEELKMKCRFFAQNFRKYQLNKPLLNQVNA